MYVCSAASGSDSGLGIVILFAVPPFTLTFSLAALEAELKTTLLRVLPYAVLILRDASLCSPPRRGPLVAIVGPGPAVDVATTVVTVDLVRVPAGTDDFGAGPVDIGVYVTVLYPRACSRCFWASRRCRVWRRRR